MPFFGFCVCVFSVTFLFTGFSARFAASGIINKKSDDDNNNMHS